MSVKRPSIIVKLALDLAMASFFIAALGFRSTGGLAHEWIGPIFCGLCFLHVAINWTWYKSILKDKYTFRRAINTVLNLMLPVGAIVLCVSGIMSSRHVFRFLNLKGGLNIRQIHSFVAYWGLVLLGIHVGIHWDKVLTVLKNKAGTSRELIFNSLLLRGLASVTAAYGIWSSFDRAMGSKLFLGFSFDFWESSRPEILFYLHNTAIMALYIIITHYSLKMIRRIHAPRIF